MCSIYFQVDCLVIHDLEPLSFAEPDAAQPIDPAKADEMLAQLSADDGGFRELQLMREEGVIKAFGAAVRRGSLASKIPVADGLLLVEGDKRRDQGDPTGCKCASGRVAQAGRSRCAQGRSR